jgi:hypothetical protein
MLPLDHPPTDHAPNCSLQKSSFGPKDKGWRAEPPVIPIAQAWKRLASQCSESKPTGARAAAINNIRQVTKNEGSTMSLKAIPLALFNDLDTYCFGGDLRHRINVRWDSPTRVGETFTTSADNINLGLTLSPIKEGKLPRVYIRLNAEATERDWATIDASPKRAVLAVMVHEMIHAYYRVRS